MAGMKVVLCPDSLKTTATAPEAATYLAEGIADTLPGVELVLVPLADGGEGTSACFSGERITLPTTTAIGPSWWRPSLHVHAVRSPPR